MARIRTIKPEFWTSEQVSNCSPTTRLLFIGMWTFADDQGIHPASYKRIKMEVFPGDEFTLEQIRRWIYELIQVGLIRQYKVKDAYYWIITGWNHQKIEKKTSKYPLPENQKFDDRSLPVPQPITDCSPLETSLMESTVPFNDHADALSSAGADVPPSDDSSDQLMDEIFDSWNRLATECKLPKAKAIEGKRRNHLKARLRCKTWVGSWREALDKIRGSPFLLGQSDRGWKANFDWFLKPDSVAKIMEGQYEHESGKNAKGIAKHHRSDDDEFYRQFEEN